MQIVTLRDYRHIEEALVVADDVAQECSPVTKAGKEIREEVRALLRKVTTERIRAEAAAESMEQRPDSPTG